MQATTCPIFFFMPFWNPTKIDDRLLGAIKIGEKILDRNFFKFFVFPNFNV